MRYNKSTVDYTSVTSIVNTVDNVRHVVTFLFHDCDKLRVRKYHSKPLLCATTLQRDREKKNIRFWVGGFKKMTVNVMKAT